MKKIYDLAFRRAKGRVNANLYAGEKDEPVDILKILRDTFDNAKEGIVRVRIIANDMSEKEEPFSRELALKIMNGEVPGRFLTAKDEEVKILSSDLKGDFPFLGVYDGTPMQWNDQGILLNGDESIDPAYRLKIMISLKKGKK